MQTVILQAPAKINLHLEVLGKRGDGFHDLSSIFHALDFSDKLYVKTLKTKEFRLNSNTGIQMEENILYHTWQKISVLSPYCPGIEVYLDKTIPIGFGTGGGSSNAAALLKYLNSIVPEPLNAAELHKLALELGSDVPFFLYDACAYVSGRGEHVAALPSREDLWAILLDPGFRISTAKAFSSLDLSSFKKSAYDSKDLRTCLCKAPEEWWFFNSFSLAMSREFPLIQKITDQFYSASAEYANLSGSGSCIFGIFSKEPNLLQIRNFFPAYPLWKVKMLASLP